MGETTSWLLQQVVNIVLVLIIVVMVSVLLAVGYNYAMVTIPQ